MEDNRVPLPNLHIIRAEFVGLLTPRAKAGWAAAASATSWTTEKWSMSHEQFGMQRNTAILCIHFLHGEPWAESVGQAAIAVLYRTAPFSKHPMTVDRTQLIAAQTTCDHNPNTRSMSLLFAGQFVDQSTAHAGLCFGQ